MLFKKSVLNVETQTETHDQGYGDLTELNRDGIILKSIGHELLKSFANDYLELLDTSSAIYEANGDYAFGIFASGWCRMMDRASRNLCHTPDNVEALNSGRWLCHESCWTDCSKEAIAKQAPVDIACNGGIRLYAMPIFACGNVIGVINFGYGDPPKDPEKLKMLAEVYHLNPDELLGKAAAYDSRPPNIIEMAKKRLHSTAKLIGSMVETKQAMEALRGSEEKHRRLFETMAQGVVYQAADGTIISANPAAERILGLSLEQMRGRSIINPRWRMIKEDGTDIPGTDHPTMLALRSGRTVGPVIRGVFHPDRNTYVWLSITVVPLFQPGETKPFQAYATFEDITERKRAEEALRESEQRFEKMLAVVPDMISIHDKDMNILYSNWQGFAEVSPEKRIINTKCHKTYRGLDNPCPDCRAQIVFETRVSFQEEVKLPDGRWVDLRVFPFIGKDGQVELFMEWVRDITDPKQAERDLVESEVRFKALHNASFGGITIHDQGVILECNQGLTEITGFGYDELIGMDGLLLIAENSREAVRNNIRSGYEKPYEVFGVRRNGEEFPLRLEARNIPYKDKMVRVVEFRDITEQKRAEEEREKLQEQLTQAQKMESVGRLAGGVAHDFNNMLGVIIGHAEMALEQVDPAQPLFPDLEEIRKAAERSAILTRQLLTFARKPLVDAVVVGIGTVLADQPRLTTRHVEGPNPTRVVLDPRGRLRAPASLLDDGAAPTLVVHAEAVDPELPAHVARLAVPPTPTGILPPAAVLAALAARGLARILVEGGGRTVSSFVAAGAVDRLQFAVAPMLIGSGRPALTLPAVETLAAALRPRVRRFDLGRDTLFDFDLHQPAEEETR